MKKKKENNLSITDAVDNLSNISELNTSDDNLKLTGIKSKLKNIKNLKKENQEELLNTVKNTFKTVHKYLEHVYQDDHAKFKDRDMQKGVKAMMILADEAVNKIKKCTSLLQVKYKDGVLDEITEYNDLHDFYTNKLLKRFKKVLSQEGEWEEEWASIEQLDVQIEHQGIKDLKMVKMDREYELFYLRKDDGKPFFNRNLLRHIKLVTDFDQIIINTNSDDPLLKIHTLIDYGSQTIAQNIREQCKYFLNDFYSEGVKHKDLLIVSKTMKTAMSLMLACNPDNLNDQKIGKACTRYLKDFYDFLRQLLQSVEYLNIMESSFEELDVFSQSLLKLIHGFCFSIFNHKTNKEDVINYIDFLFKKPFVKNEKINTIVVLDYIYKNYQNTITLLKNYPNGPLFKVLDSFQDRNIKEGFDPFNQGNIPYYLFSVVNKTFDTECLRIPCPTIHININKAEISNEFKGFLNFLNSKENKQTHLHINLQNRMSWRESARCKILETLNNQAEFSKQFILFTIPKSGSFYFQSEDYLEIDNFNDFKKQLIDQVKNQESCGFIFPNGNIQKECFQFIEKIIFYIKKYFFEDKKTISRIERLDFIEIFYQFLFLKILDIIRPNTFTFSCKDGVDIGSTTSSSFFVFIKFFTPNYLWDIESQKDLYWLMFGPSLTIRDRLVDEQRLYRIFSTLNRCADGFNQHIESIMKDIEPLYSKDFLSTLHTDY